MTHVTLVLATLQLDNVNSFPNVFLPALVLFLSVVPMVVKPNQNVNLESLDVPPSLVTPPLVYAVPPSQLVANPTILASPPLVLPSMDPIPVLLPHIVSTLVISVTQPNVLLTPLVPPTVSLNLLTVVPPPMDAVTLDVMPPKVVVMPFLNLVSVNNKESVTLELVTLPMVLVSMNPSIALIPPISHQTLQRTPSVLLWSVILPFQALLANLSLTTAQPATLQRQMVLAILFDVIMLPMLARRPHKIASL